MKSLKYNLLALAVLALAMAPSFASTVPITIYSTGQGDGPGVVDSNYTILPGAPFGGPAAYTVDPYSGLCCWATPPANTSWINPYPAEANGQPFDQALEGTYVYQTTFSLAGLDPATAQLSGLWSADNSACMSLNGGACVNPIVNQFGTLTAFSLTSGFKSGLNTLDFQVFNAGSTSGEFDPTGLLVSINGTASPSPEPSSLLLLGSGLLGLAGVARRKLMG
jgi:hypothetical protein